MVLGCFSFLPPGASGTGGGAFLVLVLAFALNASPVFNEEIKSSMTPLRSSSKLAGAAVCADVVSVAVVEVDLVAGALAASNLACFAAFSRSFSANLAAFSSNFLRISASFSLSFLARFFLI